MRISVVNYDDSLPVPELLAGIRAVNVQIERDFAPYWHMHAQLRLDAADPERGVEQLGGLRGDAIIYIVASADPRHLSHHAMHANGTPFGFVYRQPGGKPWTVSLSHEALELLADPSCNMFCKGPHPDPAEGGREVLHWFEVCDPVQAESYEIDGVPVSNFVLPLFFTGGEELDGRNDFLATRTADGRRLRSFSANPGGYVGFYDPLAPGRSQHWFADEAAACAWVDKCERLPRVFRRADRRDQPRPLEVDERRLDPPEPAASPKLVALHLRLLAGDAADHDAIERLLARTLEHHDAPGDVMHRRSEFERRDVEVFGPAIERRSLAELWELVARIEADKPAWLAYADVSITDELGDDDAELRGVRRPTRTCSCDRDDDDPDTDARDWALVRAGVLEAWALLRTRGIPCERAGEGVLIGHPDTGYTDYLARAGRIAAGGQDLLVRRSDGRDPLAPGSAHRGHGTRTGSVIAGPFDGESGLSGVAPGARLVPYRVTTSVVLGRGDLLADAIHAAVDRGVDVISMSVGTALQPRRLQDAIDRAYAANVILVAAAGNCVNRLDRDDGFVVFPARNRRCIACAAIDCHGQLWCGSSNAASVDVYAPGKSVWCVEPLRRGGVRAERRRGTSFATAIVAGVAALWLQWNGRTKLLRHCRRGVRLADLFRAVLAATGEPPKFADHHARILDARAVLEADLDEAEARARGELDGRITRPLERLRGLVPKLAEPQFDGRLAALLGVPADELHAVAGPHEAELEHRLAHDPRVRAAMLGLTPTEAHAIDPHGWSARLRDRVLATRGQQTS